jgi:hypothetical protein
MAEYHSLGEVFAAKGLMGLIISVVMAVVTLALNRALGGQAWLLIPVLALGLLFGAFRWSRSASGGLAGQTSPAKCWS